ncbi:MAG: arginase family protein [Chloroflexi bacterium]|nr:arginase family protein [Chloroflexota bacterium]
MPKTVCIGVPYYLGQPKPERREVEALRRSGVADELDAEWVDIEPNFSAADDPVVAVNRALAAAVEAHPDKVPVVFANDCTSCLGMVKGLARKAPAILWYDSHGDFNTPETTPSGFLGGMPLAALVGRGNQHLMRGMDLAPIAETDVIITDVRNLDPEEGDMLRSSDVTIHETLESLRTTGLPDRPLYIHFDTDVVDCDEMPAMSYPEPNGPTLDECIRSLEFVLAQGNTAAILFSLWNETLEGSEQAMAATRRLIFTLKSIL